MKESLETLQRRYRALAHAVQSSIAFMIEAVPGWTAHTPKHLRVGVNVAMTDLGSLVTLLIAKGVITEEEYYRALADGMQREADRMTEEARRASGIPGLTFHRLPRWPVSA